MANDPDATHAEELLSEDTRVILKALACKRDDSGCDLSLSQLMAGTGRAEHEVRNAVAKLVAWRMVDIRRINDEVWVHLAN